MDTAHASLVSLVLVAALLLAACAPPAKAPSVAGAQIQADTLIQTTARARLPDLPPGSNERLRTPLALADGIEVIISDVVIPPGATVPRHYHPGEEFIYVLEGSAVHVEQGKPDRTLRAGDAYVIPPEAEHAPRAGAEGTRAVVFRVHVEGQPERTLVDE